MPRVTSLADLLILALVGLAVERPMVIGEGLTPLILCSGNGIVGAFVLGFTDRKK